MNIRALKNKSNDDQFPHLDDCDNIHSFQKQDGLLSILEQEEPEDTV